MIDLVTTSEQKAHYRKTRKKPVQSFELDQIVVRKQVWHKSNFETEAKKDYLQKKNFSLIITSRFSVSKL